jgi:hypothetical protein
MEFIILIALQLKHWYIDFVNQTNAEVVSKGHYGELTGILHSAKHGIGTGIIFLFIDPYLAASIGLLDFILHYHIDWTKRNFGNQDIQNPKFWAHLGLDQMAHQLCYIGYVAMVVL